MLHAGGAIPVPSMSKEIAIFLVVLHGGAGGTCHPSDAPHPNSIVTLAIFVHAREMFVRVMPSMELFRYFFPLCWAGPGRPLRWSDVPSMAPEPALHYYRIDLIKHPFYSRL